LYMSTGTHTLTKGDLTFTEVGRGDTFTLSDCEPDTGFFRELTHSESVRWSIARVFDRRIAWWQQQASGEFNRRNMDGSVDESTKKNCKQLVEALLTLMGESATTTAVSTAVYPYVRFQGPPVEALENVLTRCGYDLVLKT